MKSLLPCLGVLLMLSTLSASDVGGPCVTMDSDVIFHTTEVIPSDARLLQRYPQVQYSDDEPRRPIGLAWVPTDSKTDATSEKIAEAFGKEIWRFVFWQKDGRKDGDGILCVWLGFQTKAPSGGMGFRPFLVFEGHDQVRDWESFVCYDEDDKFTVKLNMHFKGNGFLWQTSIVQIQDSGPVPLRREGGGRRPDRPPEVAPYRPARAR